MPQESIHKKPFMTWKEAVIVVLIVAALGAALLPAVRAARIAAKRAERRNNMAQIGTAFHWFYDNHKRIPDAVFTDESGHPLSSWRFRLLPWLEGVMRDVDYSLPWDDPAHEYFSSFGFSIFCSQYQRSGPGTAFDSDRGSAFSGLPDNLILVIEVPTTTIHWMEPGDIHVDDINEAVLRGPDGGGIHVLFKDGSVAFLPNDAPIEKVRWFLTIEEARMHDREEIIHLADPAGND